MCIRDRDNSDGKLRPGLFVSVTLPYGEARNAVLVNDASIGTDQLGKYLYVVKDSDICLLYTSCSGLTMVATMLPPKAGRI